MFNSIDSLEGRTFLSGALLSTPLQAPTDLAQLEIRDHVLYVTGTHRNDSIQVTRRIGRQDGMTESNEISLNVMVNPAQSGDSRSRLTIGANAFAEVFVVTTLHKSYFVDTSGIDKMIINGGAGADALSADRLIGITADIRGGDGNDTLTEGRNSHVLRGGAGDDKLFAVGGPSSHFSGGDGYDTLSMPGARYLDHNLFLDIESVKDFVKP